MTKSAPKRVKRKAVQAVEIAPGAWDRFQKAVGKILPPKRPKPKTAKA